MLLRTTALALLLSVTACTSETSGPGPAAGDAGLDADGSSLPLNPDGGITGDGGAQPKCTLTLSGAITKTGTCSAVLGGWSRANDNGSVGFNYTAGPMVNVAAGFKGEPTTRTYSNTDADAKSGMSVTDGQKTWIVSSGSNARGTYTLVVRSLTEILPAPADGKGWRVAGTLDASLEAVTQTGAAGTVTLHAEFE